MNTSRILKEARPLFWPWCAVMVAGMSVSKITDRDLDWLSQSTG